MNGSPLYLIAVIALFVGVWKSGNVSPVTQSAPTVPRANVAAGQPVPPSSANVPAHVVAPSEQAAALQQLAESKPAATIADEEAVEAPQLPPQITPGVYHVVSSIGTHLEVEVTDEEAPEQEELHKQHDFYIVDDESQRWYYIRIHTDDEDQMVPPEGPIKVRFDRSKRLTSRMLEVKAR